MRLWIGISLACLLCSQALVLPASAQQGSLPGPAQAPQIERQLAPPPAPPPASAAPALPRTPAQPVPTGAEATKFHLNQVTLDGVTVYSEAELRPFYADLIGKDVSLAQMIEVANRLTTRYRRDGYILAQAVVPEQKVEDGIVKIVVVEGFIDKVIIDGPTVGRPSIIAEFTDRIRAEKPLTAAALERNLLLIGDLPGFNVQSVLEPSPTTFGAANLHITIRHVPVSGFVETDNRGSRFIGPWTTTAGASEYSELGLDEQIDVLGSVTPGSDAFRYLEGQLTVPAGLAASGDTLQLFAAGARTKPELPTDIFPFPTRATDFDARATYFHPFIRSRLENLSLRLSFLWHDETTHTLDVPDDARNPTEDRLRILQARGTYDFTDRWLGVNLADIAVNQGLKILGASRADDPVSRLTGADGSFTYLNGTVSRLQHIVGGLALLTAVNAQYAFDPLLPTERFGVGGSQFGRGFAPGNITGDHGVAGKLELQYGEHVGHPILDSYQAYAFLDAGRTWDLNSPNGEAELSSTGIGVRLNVTDRISINPEIAQQLSGTPADDPGERRETRALVTMVARF